MYLITDSNWFHGRARRIAGCPRGRYRGTISRPMHHTALVPPDRIERAILLIRGQKVMLDRDLADLYGVPTRVLVQAVKRNRKRFPADFMFQLSKTELEQWRSQIVTSDPAAKMGLRRRPYAFTEQGVAMLSSVLHSQRAIDVNIAIMRAFVRVREMLASHKDLARKLAELEKKYDEQFQGVFEAIRQLMAPTLPENDRRIGFKLGDGTEVAVSGITAAHSQGVTIHSS